MNFLGNFLSIWESMTICGRYIGGVGGGMNKLFEQAFFLNMHSITLAWHWHYTIRNISISEHSHEFIWMDLLFS